MRKPESTKLKGHRRLRRYIVTEIMTALRSCVSAAAETLFAVKYCSPLEVATSSCGCWIGIFRFA